MLGKYCVIYIINIFIYVTDMKLYAREKYQINKESFKVVVNILYKLTQIFL